MASYKVIQDIEAEDKLVGPLSLRQFIYAVGGGLMLWLSYIAITHGAIFLLSIFVPLAAVGAFFAFPWGRDQPTEIWALAKIRYHLKPRRRIWDQSGMKELVTVTAPKVIKVEYTNGLSQIEVHSRLRALADTIDSRGWAIKNSNLNLYSQPALVMREPDSDRLLEPSDLPQEVSNVDIQASDDMLDIQNNSRAQAVDSMIEASTKAHRQQIIQNMQQPASEPAQPAPAQPNAAAGASPPNNYWFLRQQDTSQVPKDMATFDERLVTPGMGETAAPPHPASLTADEAQLIHRLDAQKNLPATAYYSHLHTIQPISNGPAAAVPAPPPATNMAIADNSALLMPPPPMTGSAAPPATPSIDQPTAAGIPPVTAGKQAAILQLAGNDDLNVATIAREAKRAAPQDNEVVIKLH